MHNNLYWAVDIGGTKILSLLIDKTGQVLYREKNPTPNPAHPEAIVKSIKETMEKAATSAGISPACTPSGLAVCIAGFVESDKKIVHQSPNLQWQKPVPLGEILSANLSCPVLIENDTNAAVVGETIYGAAYGHSDVIYVTLSTGIGGGFFLNGRLYRGGSGFAAEIGHTKPFGKGRRCKCGGNNCLEAWASGTAITEIAEDLWDKDELKSGPINAKQVFEEADSGNVLAQKIIEHAASSIGTGLANLITLLNPTCLVIGGGIAAGRKEFFEQVREIIKQEAIRPAIEITPLNIIEAELEPEAGIWGAYALITGKAE
ncbi:MAG: ROK family protein [Bacillota bacterium]